MTLHLRSLALLLLPVSQISHLATAFLTTSDSHFSTIAEVVFGLEAVTEDDDDDCFGFDETISWNYFWLTICFWNIKYILFCTFFFDGSTEISFWNTFYKCLHSSFLHRIQNNYFRLKLHTHNNYNLTFHGTILSIS